jgi:hypothetical protein
VSLAAWKRIEVGTPVRMEVTGEEPVDGNVLSSSAHTLLILTATAPRRFHWPKARNVTLDTDSQIRWIAPRPHAVHLLTIRKEEPCAP